MSDRPRFYVDERLVTHTTSRTFWHKRWYIVERRKYQEADIAMCNYRSQARRIVKALNEQEPTS